MLPSTQPVVPIVGAEDEYWLPDGYSTFNGYIVSPEEVL